MGRLGQLEPCFKLKRAFESIPVRRERGGNSGEQSDMRLLFIINPSAGASQAVRRWSAFHSQLKSPGILSDHVFTNQPGEVVQLARNASTEYDLVVAAGGDGTAAEVSEGLLTAPGRRASLGILPLGTGNDIAQVLGIEGDAKALNSFTSGKTKAIDVLEVRCQANGHPAVRYALLFAGVGIISLALKKTTPRLKRLLGQRRAYPAGLVRALATYRSPQMTVSCDSNLLQGRFLFVGASNTPIAGGGMKIAPGATLDDGLLNMNLIEATGPFAALMQLRRLCRGLHINHPKVRYLTAKCFEVDSPVALEIAADGDLIGYTPARVQIRPSALRIAVPGE
jgi:YegS/Rv2252/BmrU family lipid kinase